MKTAFIVLATFILLACKKQETVADAQLTQNTETTEGNINAELFTQQKGNCIACHQAQKNYVGPSWQQIATTYKAKKGNLKGFLQGTEKPIVNPSQYAIMQPSLEITKALTNKELKVLEAYILSFSSK